jgi:hypothetical protein
MRNIFKKIVPGMFGITLLFAAGIFFGGTVAFASDSSGSMMNCENESPTMHSAGCALQESLEKQKAGPINNTFMPCCLERHDNSQTALPSVFQDRIKFSEQAVTGEIDTTLATTTQKTYLSSKSPPKKADILSSVVKIE